MTISIKSAAAFVSGVALLFVTAAFVPGDSHAVGAPRCLFNALVLPQNNGGTTLSWRIFDATTIKLSGVGDIDQADGLVVFPNVVTTYTITASNLNGTTDCSVVAHPVSSYVGNNGVFGRPINQAQSCTVNVSPDFVVPGGTAVLTWRVPGAINVNIDNGIGNVVDTGSHVVPGGIVPVNYTVTGEYSDGTIRTCGATVKPAIGGFGGPGVNFLGPVTGPGVTAPTPYAPGVQGNPNVVVTLAPQAAPIKYVTLDQVPYTGPQDALYVLSMLLIALGIGATLFRNRRIVLG